MELHVAEARHAALERLLWAATGDTEDPGLRRAMAADAAFLAASWEEDYDRATS